MTVYRSVKPLAGTTLGTLPFLPSAWRTALSIFIGTLDTVVATTIDPTTGGFKAGKDLAIAEME